MRTRIKYLIAIIVTIILGLSSRKFSDLLPVLIAKHAGDMLWASMVYFGFRFCLIKERLIWAAGSSVVFSFAIEFSQMYQAEWIVALRDTVLGALVLGKGFLTVDLVRYVLGIAIAYGLDTYWLRRK
ncbi:ribosomal maturation YjgA family protein [Paenibacillus sp. UNC451MF]|uniref:ribosomal maturation YjgA family protein n=1 Tax=Paenibacillus sp. UNC451MF TaxID=1449063 RepID=UPI000B16E0E5|nr:DUF2809 domain-containing protein [Paenibacillus sp. UNC451MF]